jgi:2-methylcitrate dehydratase
MRSNLKQYPAEGHSQSAITTAAELRHNFLLDDVESIAVDTCWSAYHEIGSEPAKWDPQTRETADHSFPYLLALAFKNGTVATTDFTEQAILDPSLRPLMQKISITWNQEFTDRFPAEFLTDITVKTRSGETFTARTGQPRGNYTNPMTDAELEQKFLSTASEVWDAERSRTTLDRLWLLQHETNAAEMLRLFR